MSKSLGDMSPYEIDEMLQEMRDMDQLDPHWYEM